MPSTAIEDYLKQIYLRQQGADEGLVPMGTLSETMRGKPNRANGGSSGWMHSRAPTSVATGTTSSR